MRTIIFFILLCFPFVLSAETSYLGLQPGTSSRADAERILGPPVSPISETLFEYGPQSTAAKVYVQYRRNSSIVERIEILLSEKSERFSLLSSLKLSDRASTTEVSKGRMMEYFGSPHYIVLTYSGDDASSGIRRIGYYSKQLFESSSASASASAAKDPRDVSSSNTRIKTNEGSHQIGKAEFVLEPDKDGWGFNNEIATILTYYGATSAASCRVDCEKNPKCMAYSWIRPSGILPGDPPMCYLMSAWIRMMQHPCCISAVKTRQQQDVPTSTNPVSKGTFISDLKAPAVITGNEFSPFTIKASNSSGILHPDASITIVGELNCSGRTVAYSNRPAKIEKIDSSTLLVHGVFIPFMIPKGKCDVSLRLQDLSGNESNTLKAPVEFK
jgi:hypothetical protein